MSNCEGGEYPRGNAVKLYEEEVKNRESTLGCGDPVTLKSMDNLAQKYRLFGHPKKAMNLYKRVLAIRKKIRGDEHLDTLTSMNNLSLTYHSLYKRNPADKMDK